jgi:FkbM family methyltransferase
VRIGVVPIDVALGKAAHEISIQLENSSPGGRGINYDDDKADRRTNQSHVKVIAFGEWLAEASTPFSLLKLDCEGVEWENIKGCGHRIGKRFRIIQPAIREHPEKTSNVDAFPRIMEKYVFYLAAGQQIPRPVHQ